MNLVQTVPTEDKLPMSAEVAELRVERGVSQLFEITCPNCAHQLAVRALIAKKPRRRGAAQSADPYLFTVEEVASLTVAPTGDRRGRMAEDGPPFLCATCGAESLLRKRSEPDREIHVEFRLYRCPTCKAGTLTEEKSVGKFDKGYMPSRGEPLRSREYVPE